MAKLFLLHLSTILLAAATNPTTDATTATQELETALQTLRTRGYNLFTNAIATSDLQLHLLNTTTSERFTIFSPKDPAIYALDMATDAAAYLSTLRYHVIPLRRLAFADLCNLSAAFIETLLPHYSVLIGTVKEEHHGDAVSGVMVDGVRVSDPDLFLGSRFCVHGIDGILVTGLNTYYEGRVDDFTGLGPVLAPVSDGPGSNIPVASPPANLGHIHGNIPAAQPVSSGNIPVASPAANLGYRKGNIRAAHPVSSGNIPVASPPANLRHSKGNVPAAQPVPWKNIPVAPPVLSHGKEHRGGLGLRKGRKHHRRGGDHRRNGRRVDHHLLLDL